MPDLHTDVAIVGAGAAGIAAGRPHRIRVTHFAEQIARQAAQAEAPVLPTLDGRRVATVRQYASNLDILPGLWRGRDRRQSMVAAKSILAAQRFG